MVETCSLVQVCICHLLGTSWCSGQWECRNGFGIVPSWGIHVHKGDRCKNLPFSEFVRLKSGCSVCQEEGEAPLSSRRVHPVPRWTKTREQPVNSRILFFLVTVLLKTPCACATISSVLKSLPLQILPQWDPGHLFPCPILDLHFWFLRKMQMLPSDRPVPKTSEPYQGLSRKASILPVSQELLRAAMSQGPTVFLFFFFPEVSLDCLLPLL